MFARSIPAILERLGLAERFDDEPEVVRGKEAGRRAPPYFFAGVYQMGEV